VIATANNMALAVNINGSISTNHNTANNISLTGAAFNINNTQNKYPPTYHKMPIAAAHKNASTVVNMLLIFYSPLFSRSFRRAPYALNIRLTQIQQITQQLFLLRTRLKIPEQP
jgi:hypothetical protein